MKLQTSSMVRVALFAALIALGTHIRIPLGPVPFTLQNLFAALAGFLLGPRDGLLAWAVFLAAGFLGLPVFPSGGGPGLLFHPTFGFVLGFGPCAWICGRFGQGRLSLKKTALVASAGFGSVYLLGLPWLWALLNWVAGTPMGFGAVFKMGFLIFLPTDLLKIAAVTLLARRIAGRHLLTGR